jgi:hypothetical protein
MKGYEAISTQFGGRGCTEAHLKKYLVVNLDLTLPVSPFINASFNIRNERGWIADLRTKGRWKIKVLS